MWLYQREKLQRQEEIREELLLTLYEKLVLVSVRSATSQSFRTEYVLRADIIRTRKLLLLTNRRR